MRLLAAFMAACFWVGGLGALVYALDTPTRFNMAAASAIQATQVYAEAQLYALVGIGLLLAGAVLALGGLWAHLSDFNNRFTDYVDVQRKSSLPG